MVRVSRNDDRLQRLKKAMKWAQNTYILVGVPQSKSRRQGDPMTNAELLHLHTRGSPLKHLPERPVIEPALQDSQQELSALLKDALKSVTELKEDEALAKLKAVGMQAQNVSRAWFVNPRNGWKPNSPITYQRKQAKGATINRPLIDTGQLRRSIIYVVVNDGQREGD